ncbi:MAG TPA: S8 family serine peptidase, partial [Thermoanaerobaculia bacterium]|nr:S8 family serine peptidase [Thermoanaerobaculia bacterium]
ETQSFCFDLGLCPSEFELAVFTAVQNATANDRIVVAAAGNGGSNLDDPDFEGRFNRSVRDSGAIIVAGATSTHPHVPTDTTNYGSRIDAHAWGENVTTTGGNGDLFRAGSDPEQEYTESFNGTSAASPIVTGAAAVIQGVRLARGLPPLTSVQMRAALQAGATPQGAGGNIGSMPNLEAAIAAIPTSAPEITATGNASSVFISWPALSGVSHYELYKRINAGSVWQLIYTGSAPQFTDTAVVSGRTYGYKARAIVGAGAPSAFSNFELATTITFTDPVITSFVTLVKAKHIVELRTAVNAMCTFATTTLCSTPRYSGSDLDENFVKTQTITAAHFTSIRTNTVSLRHAIGASPTSFRETTPIGALIKRIHMEDLRTGAN